MNNDLCSYLFSPHGFTWTLLQTFTEKSVQRMSLKIRSASEVRDCMSFEMSAAGVRRVPFPSSQEANSLKKKWRRCLGKRSRLTSISANGYYQFLCIPPSKVIFQPQMLAQSHSTTRACKSRFTFCAQH